MKTKITILLAAFMVTLFTSTAHAIPKNTVEFGWDTTEFPDAKAYFYVDDTPGIVPWVDVTNGPPAVFGKWDAYSEAQTSDITHGSIKLASGSYYVLMVLKQWETVGGQLDLVEKWRSPERLIDFTAINTPPMIILKRGWSGITDPSTGLPDLKGAVIALSQPVHFEDLQFEWPEDSPDTVYVERMLTGEALDATGKDANTEHVVTLYRNSNHAQHKVWLKCPPRKNRYNYFYYFGYTLLNESVQWVWEPF